MRSVILFLSLLGTSAYAQTFVQAAFHTNSSANSSNPVTISPTAGNCLIAYATVDAVCSSPASSNSTADAFKLVGNGTPAPTFTSVIPNGTGFGITITIDNPGVDYVSTPTVTSNCATPGTLGASMSGTSPNLTVATINITVPPSGCGPTAPTITFSGGSPTTPATAHISVFGIQSGTQCSAMLYACSIGTGITAVTFNHPTIAFTGAVVQEWSGLTGVFDSEADGESASVTAGNALATGTLNPSPTTQANEVGILGVSIINTSVGWTATSGWTIPTNGLVASTGGDYGIATEYRIFSATQSGTINSPIADKTAAMNEIVGTFKATASSGSKTPAHSGTF